MAGFVVRPVYNIVKMIVFHNAWYGAKWSNQEIKSISQCGASLHESLDPNDLFTTSSEELRNAARGPGIAAFFLEVGTPCSPVEQGV